jgi:hypothetical protein
MNLQSMPEIFLGNHVQKISCLGIPIIDTPTFDINKLASSISYKRNHQVFGTFSTVVGMLYSQDMLIKLRFGELLKQRGITPNRLWKSGHGLSRNTVYGLANPPSDRIRIDLDVLAQAMNAVYLESGQNVSLNDVLEIVEEPVEPMDIETRAWHDADLSRLGEVEPYDWGVSDPNSLGVSVINGVVQR